MVLATDHTVRHDIRITLNVTACWSASDCIHCKCHVGSRLRPVASHVQRQERTVDRRAVNTEVLALEYSTAEPVARHPESCTLDLPVLDIACQPFRDLVSVSKGSVTSFSGSRADMRLSICSWPVNTSRNSLFSAAMSSCGLQPRSL